MSWFKSMQKYSMKGINNMEQLTKDVDLELIPKIIEKIVLDKIDRMNPFEYCFCVLITNKNQLFFVNQQKW